MSTITKECAELKAFITGFLTDPMHDDKSSNSLTAEVFRIALASLEAEPVAYIRDGFREDGVHFCGGIITAEEHERTKPALSDRYNWKHRPLYTAPPAPVAMKDHQIRELVNELRDIAVEYHGTQQLRERIARTVRAAMLQGAENAESRCSIQAAPVLDSLPKNAESRCSMQPAPASQNNELS